MSKKISAIQLKSSIDLMLREYGEEVSQIVPKVTKEVLVEASDELKSAGDFKGKKYRRSWTYDIDDFGYRVEGIVYNEKHYQLTHLLEFGHVKQNGGRTRAFPHIEPVNKQVQEKFEKKLIERIQGL